MKKLIISITIVIIFLASPCLAEISIHWNSFDDPIRLQLSHISFDAKMGDLDPYKKQNFRYAGFWGPIGALYIPQLQSTLTETKTYKKEITIWPPCHNWPPKTKTVIVKKEFTKDLDLDFLALTINPLTVNIWKIGITPILALGISDADGYDKFFAYEGSVEARLPIWRELYLVTGLSAYRTPRQHGYNPNFNSWFGGLGWRF